MTGPAGDPGRCWTCGQFEDAHHAAHPFRRIPGPRTGGLAGHQLTLSAHRPVGCPTVRMIATCGCLGWHGDLIVPAGMARDADRHLRGTWLEHAATPAVTPIPAWLTQDGIR